MTPDHIDEPSQGNLVTQVNLPLGALVHHVLMQLPRPVHELHGMRRLVLDILILDLPLVFANLPITLAELVGQIPLLL